MARRGPRQDEAERTWRETHRRHQPDRPVGAPIEYADAAQRIARLCHEAIEAKRARLASLAARARCIAAHPHATDDEVRTFAAIAEQYDREQIDTVRSNANGTQR